MNPPDPERDILAVGIQVVPLYDYEDGGDGQVKAVTIQFVHLGLEGLILDAELTLSGHAARDLRDSLGELIFPDPDDPDHPEGGRIL